MMTNNKKLEKNMYAIVFDIEIYELKKNYGESYNSAFDEIKSQMKELGFKWIQGNFYITKETETLTVVYKAIQKLSSIQWFKKSVRDIRAFKVDDLSDFTGIVKE